MSDPIRLRAKYKYYWPGNKPGYICEGHKQYMDKVATAIGLYIHTEESDEDVQCNQEGTNDCPILVEGWLE